MFLSPSSISNLAFDPSHTTEAFYAIVFGVSNIEFCTNQMLISSDLKLLSSSTILLYISIIRLSHWDDSFFSRVEVDLVDIRFINPDDYFYFGDLFVWLKGVTVCELVVWSSCTRFSITERDSKSMNQKKIRLHFLKSQIAKFLNT